LKAICVQIVIFFDVTPEDTTGGYSFFDGTFSSIFMIYPEIGGSMFFRNFSRYGGRNRLFLSSGLILKMEVAYFFDRLVSSHGNTV
jgi:hypothetical protein